MFASCLLTPASATRSTSSTCLALCSSTVMAGPTRIPSSAPTRTHRWSMGWASSAGGSAVSRPRRPCSASRSRCSCPRLSESASSVSSRKDRRRRTSCCRIAERLRRHGVVGKFVEFYGPGISAVPLENRATIGNMSPEYGSTCAMFPIDAETLRYLRFTGRPPEQIALVEAYAKEQGLFHEPAAPDPLFCETIELDLGAVVPSIAGPARPHDRVALTEAKRSFRVALAESSMPSPPFAPRGADEASAQSFPASDPPASNAGGPRRVGSPRGAEQPQAVPESMPERSHRPTAAMLASGDEVTLDHGDIVIAAITSCTNTSNPSVMIGAGLLARNAVACGLTTKSWVKTSLAPGSRVVIDYLAKAGLLEPLEALGYHLVGFGCTTCIGNSGPLLDGVSEAVRQSDLAVCAVLSGNRNFEGRIHPDVRMNYLASPPLVVAYALAGTLDTDLIHEPLGAGVDGTPVFLRDIWPTSAEVAETVRGAVDSDMFRQSYEDAFTGDENWRSLDIATGASFALAGFVELHPPAAILRRHGPRTRSAARHRRRAGACVARRQHHDRSHLPGRLHHGRRARRCLLGRARRAIPGLQLLRRSPREP